MLPICTDKITLAKFCIKLSTVFYFKTVNPEVTWFWILPRIPEFKVIDKASLREKKKKSHEKPHCIVELSEATVTAVVSQTNP